MYKGGRSRACGCLYFSLFHHRHGFLSLCNYLFLYHRRNGFFSLRRCFSLCHRNCVAFGIQHSLRRRVCLSLRYCTSFSRCRIALEYTRSHGLCDIGTGVILRL